jgi:uncharacterized membrane protein
VKVMPMNKYLAGFLATALTMTALDMLWLGVIAKPMYQQEIGRLLAERPKIMPAIMFYVFYAAGLLIFAISPQGGDIPWSRATILGALFGFFAYATYDLSNLATLKNWPLGLTIIDMAWGTALSAVSAGIGKFGFDWASKV